MENYLHGTGRFWFASLKRLFCFETKRLRSLFPCRDVWPALFFGLKADVHFCRRGHLKQLVEQGNVYVSVCGSVARLEEGPRRNEGLEGKREEYSRSLGRDALEMVVGREE